MTVGELAAALFAGEPQGGPEWADGVITTSISRMRAKIKQHGLSFRIWSDLRGYRLEAA